MAKTVFNTEEILLDDETMVVLKPARIKTQKKLATFMEDFGEQKTEADFLDKIVRAAALLLAPNYPAFEDVDHAEDVLDIETCYKILDVCGGIKLNDPKLEARARELMALAAVTETGEV